jgi:hypothetical protein
MSLKVIINQIFNDNTNYLTAQQALNQARSLKSLSNDLYTDPLRFVYELVQNCDDACQPKSILRIAIVDHRYLIVGHNGKPFDEEDVRGLCDVGCSTKGQDKQKTGYKGLGFKAVFGKSDYVLVLSQGEYFRFDPNSSAFKWNSKWGPNKSSWEQRNKRTFEFPWQICPIWTEKDEVPESIQKWFIGQLDAVATIIRLKNIEETRNAIQQLIDEPHVFMFLRNIRTVKFSFNSSNETSLNINLLRDGSLNIIYDWKYTSHWLLHPCEILVPENARNDSRLPEKLQYAKIIEMILAARIDKNDNIGSVQGRNNALFGYLPTKITTYNLPILVNTNFLTNASREHIHTDSAWNQFLFSRIPHEMMNWIGKLMQQKKWSDKALDLLPNPIEVKDSLAEKYNENCPKAVIEVPFLLNFHKKILKISEAVIDVTGFSRPDCIGNDLIRDFILRTYSPKPSIASHPFVSNSKRVRKFKILLFDWDNCLNMLNSNDFLMNFTSEQNIQFINYLFNNQQQELIQVRLRKLPFLMDRMGILRMTNNIYIPSQFNNADWSAMNDTDFYVHDNIMLWLKNNTPVLNWLKSLGVTEKTDEMFVCRKIIPNVRTYITSENALPTIKKLFAGFQHGHIRNELLQKLNKMKLFSVEETLVPADELYFSDPYAPDLSFSKFHLDKASFLSPTYINEIRGAANLMKKFFLLLGVQEDIKLIRFNEEQHNELVAAYRFKQTENLFRYSSLQFERCLTFSFLDVTQRNYDFALYFWQHVINSKSIINQLNESEILVCDQNQIRKVDNLPYWFVRARVCIPTTTKQLLKSTDVFSSDLRSIVGDLLPIFACITPTPFPSEWQRFFEFKTQLSIQDHIQLLNLIYDRSKNSPLNDENETCIQRIYTSLINCLPRFDKRKFDEYRPQSPFYLLSTKNNEFLPSTNLVISLGKDFTLPNEIPQLKLSTGNSRDAHLTQLLDFFNIRQVGINDLALPTNINAQPAFSLRAKLRNMQPNLFELARSLNITDHRIDNDLQVFEVDRLELYYNGTIPVLKMPIHVIDNRIYITRPWNSRGVMSKLPQILCKQFKLPSNIEQNIHQYLLDDQIISSVIPLSLDTKTDLLRMEGTRAKFAMTIDRDNTQLFNHLGITDAISPAELLTIALDSQDSPYSGYVYHHTHLENAVSILRDRALKCRNNLSVNHFKDSAAKNIIQTTRNEVKDYARFYFRPLTPTQYCNENLGLPNLSNRYGNQPMCPVPVIFRIDLEAILSIENIQWKISLGNMANPQTEFDNTMNVVKKFDFQGVYSDVCTERGKYSSQQEFLIKSQLNFDELKDENIRIIFQDENARDSLERMITHNHLSNIDPSFYFGLNPRIIINYTDTDNEIIVFMKEGISGQLILQLSGNDTNRTIEGNLTKSFQRGTISTVYSNQQLSFIADLNNIEYAIYYEYENQIWLIHTNSPEPHFISPIQ